MRACRRAGVETESNAMTYYVVEIRRRRHVLTRHPGLPICLATVEYSLDRYTALFRAYLFVAKRHSPITYSESVQRRREAPQMLYISMSETASRSTTRSPRSESRLESFLRSDRVCVSN